MSAEPLRIAVPDGGGWRTEVVERVTGGEPARFGEPGARADGLGQLALVTTLVLGTAGLPHILNRFFTAPTGRAARTTGVWVLAFAGLFYTLAVMLGVAARQLLPGAVADHPWLAELTVDGVLRVPEQALLALGRLYGGQAGLGVVALGALVAVMSTMAGLLLAGAASIGHDVYEQHVNPDATPGQAVLAGRLAVLLMSVLTTGLAVGLGAEVVGGGRFASLIAQMVTWAFAVAGSALTPVVLLAIWWPRLTARGAVAGMTVGAIGAVGAVVAGLATGQGTAGFGSVLHAPSLVTASLGATAAIVVSRRSAAPASAARSIAILHGTAADRRTEALASLTIRGL